MRETAASAQPARFDHETLARAARSIQHPLARALLVLTFTTGLVDAVSYLGLGRVFTANMTGNIVLLGFGVAGSGGAARPGTAGLARSLPARSRRRRRPRGTGRRPPSAAHRERA